MFNVLDNVIIGCCRLIAMPMAFTFGQRAYDIIDACEAKATCRKNNRDGSWKPMSSTELKEKFGL